MSKVTMGQILSETEAFIKQSSAQFKSAGYAPASTVGGDGSGMPGSECDKPVGEDAKKPNPEVSQGWPQGVTTGGGSDSEKIEGATALDATQPVAKPAQEALVTADANAEPKTGAAKAASIANDLLSSIRNFQEGQTKAAAAPMAPAPKAAAAPSNSVELTSDVLAKIASVILATEDGIAFAESALTKAAGAEAARETFDFLQKQAAYAQGETDAEAMIAGLVAQDADMKKQAEAEYLQGQADAQELIKLAVAKVQGNRGNAILTKLAQEVADESVGDAAGGMPPEAMPPEMGGEGMPPEMGSAPADEEISPEELEHALAELVQEGQIQPEAAQAIIEAISAAEQGGDTGSESAEGALPPEHAGGEEAPAAPEEEAAAEEAAKEAMAKRASALVAAIRKQKSAQAR